MSASEKERKALCNLMDALVQEITLPPLLPDDVTAPRLAKQKIGISIKGCYNWLEAKVNTGELIKVKCRGETGLPIFAYRRKEEEKK